MQPPFSPQPGPDNATDVVAAILSDPDRIAALNGSGFAAASDPALDRFAATVRVQLQVPVALVSLVAADHQIFPGMQGLPEPWATVRRTPLSHSFCQHVVTGGEPLIVTDARRHALLRDNLAIPDLGVVAYAGMPLTDEDGRALGSLCAIDTAPRSWTEADLNTLADLAAMCSTELRLRLHSRRSTQPARPSQAFDELVSAHDRHLLLLGAAQALAGARSLAQIRREVSDLVTGELTPTYTGLMITEPGGALLLVLDPRQQAATPGERYALDDLAIPARAVGDRQLLCYPTHQAVAREFPPATVRGLRELGIESIACAPLIGTTDVLGVLVFGWDSAHVVESPERVVLSTIAAYIAQALERVRFVEKRVSVAREMQQAMLTELPDVAGLDLAARYVPAARDEAVGGDWYDAIMVPQPAGPEGRVLALTVGTSSGMTYMPAR